MQKKNRWANLPEAGILWINLFFWNNIKFLQGKNTILCSPGMEEMYATEAQVSPYWDDSVEKPFQLSHTGKDRVVLSVTVLQLYKALFALKHQFLLWGSYPAQWKRSFNCYSIALKTARKFDSLLLKLILSSYSYCQSLIMPHIFGWDKARRSKILSFTFPSTHIWAVLST